MYNQTYVFFDCYVVGGGDTYLYVRSVAKEVIAPSKADRFISLASDRGDSGWLRLLHGMVAKRASWYWFCHIICNDLVILGTANRAFALARYPTRYTREISQRLFNVVKEPCEFFAVLSFKRGNIDCSFGECIWVERLFC